MNRKVNISVFWWSLGVVTHTLRMARRNKGKETWIFNLARGMHCHKTYSVPLCSHKRLYN